MIYFIISKHLKKQINKYEKSYFNIDVLNKFIE